MAMATESESGNIWKWCNARKRICKARKGAPIGIAMESKVAERQCAMDLIEHPATPDLVHAVPKSRTFSSVEGFLPSQSHSPTSTSSTSSYEVERVAEEGASLMSLSQSPGLADSSKDSESGASVNTKSKAPRKIPARHTRLKKEGKAKLKRGNSSVQGLDLLVHAICLLENCFADFLACGSSSTSQDHESSSFKLPILKKRVIRRAKSAYKTRQPELPNQSQNQSPIGFQVPAADVVQDQVEQQAYPLPSGLRRSARAVHVKHYYSSSSVR
eukprot:TRINITY_DN6295_c0_g1_i1.p1 TRINITY_DN6295_c0_g1~~TRINITY_DN6295_c0_g1_i1.p1  ORF type:complete len:272 (+),score=28.48 TRINITY_DN6295_c0_g1_i1:169-984(+)